MNAVPEPTAASRFLTVEQVAEELIVSDVQVRALLRTGELRGIQVGGGTCGGSMGA